MDVTFSVIIPTLNRMENLEEVLHALTRQEKAPPFEVIVIDDGSREPVSSSIDPASYPTLHLTLARQENRGPAAARNRGVDMAAGTHVALLGDDTVPDPNWLAAHAAAHRRHTTGIPLAVVGHIDWHSSIRQTAFLRYINEEGVQFGYKDIQNPENLPYTYFYSSNISLRREVLKEEPFCTDFKAAAWEDTELGLRLKKKRRLHLIYAPEAQVYHRHPMSFTSFAQRQHTVGRVSSLFYEMHPEIGPMVGLTEEGPQPLPPRFPFLCRTMIIRLCEHLNLSLPGIWKETLRYHFLRGQHEVWLNSGMSSPRRICRPS